MNSISILNFIQNKKNQKEAKQIVNDIEEIKQIEQTIEDDIEQIQTDITAETAARTIADAEINRKVDMLYKISDGVLWDIEQREESGAAQLPKGGEFGNIDEVRGKTEQGENPAPDNPQEIISVDSFTVRHTDADGNTLDERTIIPPRPLNAIGNGDYNDKLNVVSGEWEYNFDNLRFGDLPWNDSDVSRYIFRTSYLNAYKVKPPVNGNSIGNYLVDSYTQKAYSPLSASDDGRFGITEAFSVRLVVVDTRFSSIGDFKSGTENVVLVYQLTDPTTLPIDPTALDYLRNLTLLPGETLTVMDNHGRDVSYLMSDFINLKKAVEQ